LKEIGEDFLLLGEDFSLFIKKLPNPHSSLIAGVIWGQKRALGRAFGTN
jgi:hypothetical protein